jgi:hypothetical protein
MGLYHAIVEIVDPLEGFHSGDDAPLLDADISL